MLKCSKQDEVKTALNKQIEQLQVLVQLELI